MSKCCCGNVFGERNYNFIIDGYGEPNFPGSILLNGMLITEFNVFVWEALLYKDYLKKRSKCLPSETLRHIVPLKQCWRLSVDLGLNPEVWLYDTNLEKIKKPLKENIPIPDNEAILLHEKWRLYRLSLLD